MTLSTIDILVKTNLIAAYDMFPTENRSKDYDYIKLCEYCLFIFIQAQLIEEEE